MTVELKTQVPCMFCGQLNLLTRATLHYYSEDGVAHYVGKDCCWVTSVKSLLEDKP